jgi:hypothetical protein
MTHTIRTENFLCIKSEIGGWQVIDLRTKKNMGMYKKLPDYIN